MNAPKHSTLNDSKHTEWAHHNKALSAGGLYANEQQVREVFSSTNWGSNGHSVLKEILYDSFV